MNIFQNFILHKTKKFDCKYPDWMNSFIISSLKRRTKYTKRFYKNSSDYNKDLLNNQAPKTYWSIISRFLNKRKMPAIPPFLADGKLVSDFKIKSELFNYHFATQCTPVKSGSTLPKFKYRTDTTDPVSCTINGNDIFLIIKNLNADKAHG